MKIHKEIVWNKGVNPRKDGKSFSLSSGKTVQSSIQLLLATLSLTDGTRLSTPTRTHSDRARTTELMCGRNCRSKRKAHAEAWTNQNNHLYCITRRTKMKYECENCGAFYSDEDVTEEGEMREDYLGVRFWATFHYCPCYGEEVITDEDYEDTETIEDINKSLYSEWMRQAL